MAPQAPVLTAVERRLLELVAAGRSLVAAGNELALDTRAVTATVGDLRTRFGVASTAAAVDAARAAGLLGSAPTGTTIDVETGERRVSR